MISLQVLGSQLINEISPAGIVSFEFAGNLAKAKSILSSWDSSAKVYAGLSLGLDFVFLLAYSCAIGMGCVLISEALTPSLRFLKSLGAVFAWGFVLAAVLDALENYALLRLLVGSSNELWPVVAQWAATPKFVLVALGLIYVILGSGWLLLFRSRE